MRSCVERMIQGALTLLLAATAAACSPVYERTELTGETGAAISVQLGRSVEIPEGVAVGITAHPLDTGGSPWPEPEGIEPDEFDLRSEAPDVLEVIRVPAHEEDDSLIDFTRDPAPISRVFIFAGHKVGTTTLLITLAGETVERIPALVVPQTE